MGGVAPGSPVSAANTNSAFLEKNADDATVGKIDLNNVDPSVSGPFVANIQKEINGLGVFLGRASGGAYNSLPTWVSNDVGISIDDVKTRADNISAKFNPTTGHKHTGTSQDAPKIDYLFGLNGIQLTGAALQEPVLTGVTGTTWDVSTELAAEAPSTGSTIEGIVANAPLNIVQLFDTSGNAFETPGGDKIYGRITNTGGLGGTWTLSFFYLLVGVETAWNFTSSTDIVWWPQKLYNETNRPVYSDQFLFSSNLLAGEIPDATQTIKGKVLLQNSSSGPVAAAGTVGTPNARVANEDHQHQGVHQLSTDAGVTPIYGDIDFVGLGGTVFTQTGSTIRASSPPLASSAPSPIGATGAVGTGTTIARDDHVHEGLHSIAKSGDPQILGDATLSAGSNVTLTQVGNDIQIAVGGFSVVTQTAALNDNQVAPSPIYSTPVAAVRGLKITYGIKRATGNSRNSDFWISTDGTSVSYVDGLGTELGSVGVTLSADISGGNLRLLYTSTNTGNAPDIKFEVKAIPA